MAGNIIVMSGDTIGRILEQASAQAGQQDFIFRYIRHGTIRPLYPAGRRGSGGRRRRAVMTP
jgi:hypothetical protein